jgi:uncharacterized protein
MKNFEVRTIHLRAEQGQTGDPEYTLRGHAFTYGKLSRDLGGFRERIKPGAAARALDAPGCDVRMLFNHNDSVVLGRQSAGTLKLSETPDGLAFRCQLDKNNSQHRDIYASVKRGDISDMSFAFNVPADGSGEDWTEETDENGQRCTVRSIKSFEHIYDVSVVTHPAYDGTSVSARHALDALPVESRSRAKEVFLKTLFGKALDNRSIQQQFIDRYGFDPWLEEIRARRFALELRVQRAADARRPRVVDLRPLTADEVYEMRRKLEEVKPDDDYDFCPGDDDEADAEDHERAAIWHSNRATKCKDVDSASRHYDASARHRQCAESLTAETACRARTACRYSYANNMKGAVS